MSVTVILELPEDVLVDALRRLSPERRRQLFLKLERGNGSPVRGVPASELDQWTGLITVGGDALAESEQLYDDSSCA
ncbi:MAG: hypothetical protein M5U01_40515 [Ardenticatenaceae bacterium]|nr:hypothetical protein [Ardenticatenaceae bacterium]